MFSITESERNSISFICRLIKELYDSDSILFHTVLGRSYFLDFLTLRNYVESYENSWEVPLVVTDFGNYSISNSISNFILYISVLFDLVIHRITKTFSKFSFNFNLFDLLFSNKLSLEENPLAPLTTEKQIQIHILTCH